MFLNFKSGNEFAPVVEKAAVPWNGELAVILHADIADSTALLQHDEAIAHEQMGQSFRRFEKIIGKYSGRICELRGDALLASFKRTSDALSAALAFQQAQADQFAGKDASPGLLFRIGISLGEVIFEEHLVTGVGVVLAQRAEQLAQPGGVCITTAIHEALPRSLPFAFESLGDCSLKGFSEPVRLYRATLKPGHKLTEPARKRVIPRFSSPRSINLVLMLALLLAGSVTALDHLNQQPGSTALISMTAGNVEQEGVESGSELIRQENPKDWRNLLDGADVSHLVSFLESLDMASGSSIAVPNKHPHPKQKHDH